MPSPVLPPAPASGPAAGSVASDGGAMALVPEPVSYEAALAELERLVGRIDAGQLPLDELLSGYRRGAALLQFCRQRLQAVEEQIKVLDDGVLRPWTPT